jgi:teichuronic acid biosynthesis glycosyltransferase TuaC
MGDDIIGTNNSKGSYTLASSIFSRINRFLARHIYNHTVVKSTEMLYKIGNNPKISLIANGVDVEKFKPVDKLQAFEKTKLDPSKKHILFVSNPERVEKNFQLAKEAVDMLKDTNVHLDILSDVPNDQLLYYYSSADALILTSFHEGSPNVVKEAMACNCPIVSTKVGDVEWLFDDLLGHYISNFSPHEISNNIIKAINFREQNKVTKGRDRIFELKLDNESVADKIYNIYKLLINN